MRCHRAVAWSDQDRLFSSISGFEVIRGLCGHEPRAGDLARIGIDQGLAVAAGDWRRIAQVPRRRWVLQSGLAVSMTGLLTLPRLCRMMATVLQSSAQAAPRHQPASTSLG